MGKLTNQNRFCRPNAEIGQKMAYGRLLFLVVTFISYKMVQLENFKGY